MSDPEETVADRARTLIAAARQLVESGRLARQAAARAQARARDLLAHLTGSGRTSFRRRRQTPDVPGVPWDRRTVNRRLHERLARPGRRESDRRAALAQHRRVLVAGPDAAWRLVTAYVFEEAGYVVNAAADPRQAIALATQLLPDVVVVWMAAPEALEVMAQLASTQNTIDIPVVLLTSSLQSSDARDARAAGAVTLLAHGGESDVLVGEVDTLIAVAPRVQRTLKRRLLDLRELARHYPRDADGEARLRQLIDRLQVAILAVDERGRCIAASQGATRLTGYTRLQLLTASVFNWWFDGGDRWESFLANRQCTGTTTITTHSGEQVTVHAAAVAEILPGFHVAAFAAVSPRPVSEQQ